MSQMQDIAAKLQAQFGEAWGNVSEANGQAWLQVHPGQLLQVCEFLRNSPELYFDFLQSLSAVDLGAQSEELQAVYHFESITKGLQCVVKVNVPKEKPQISSISQLWRSADWHEREAYDLMGIVFEGHPDLRRILLPEDWEGHPLRKDYVNPEYYHDVQTAY
jgi:NADH-quinone oxidoreductase subunit C